MTSINTTSIRNRKLLAILITLALLVTQFAALPVYAAAGTVKVVLTAPADVDLNVLQVTMKQGYPTSSGITESALNNLTTVPVNFEGPEKLEYLITTPGTYSFYSRGEGYYRVVKLFNVTQANIDAGAELNILIPNGPLGAEGYQPGPYPTFAQRKADDYEGDDYIPTAATADSRDVIIAVWPDELRAVFDVTDEAFAKQKAAAGNTNPIPYPFPAGGFDSPTYNNMDKLGMYQIALNEMLEEFIEDKMDNFTQGTGGVYAYYTSLGETPFYKLSMPIVVFAKESGIAAAETLDEVAAILRENDKPTVWHQGSIHANEPAATEGASAIMSEMFGSYGANILDKINVVILPRVSIESSRIYSRANILGVDPNRGHLNADSIEQNMVHQAFQLFMPEVAQDGHEFDFYGANAGGYMSNSNDIETTEAGQLNVSDTLQALAVDMNDFVQSQALDSGLRMIHYGPAVSPGVGRSYYNMLGTATILVETRGIGAGGTDLQHYARRTYSQYVAAKAIDEYTAKNAAEIMRVTKETRDDLVAWGKTYDPTRMISVDYTLTANRVTYRAPGAPGTAPETPRVLPVYQYNLDGTLTRTPTVTGNAALGYYYVSGRDRTRPTGYILPLDAPNLDKILYMMDQQMIYYYEVAPGTKVDKLSQYYWVSGTAYNNRKADLRDEGSVTFDQGAIIVPMDQVNSTVIAMTLEPDFNDSGNYRTTLTQQGTLTYDTDSRNYPLYRYQGDNPSEIAPAVDKDLRMTTNAHLVKKDDYVVLKTFFNDQKESNAAILNYAFDGDKFEYASFTPAEGVSVYDTQYGDGWAKITLGSMNYDLKDLGELMLYTKSDLDNGEEKVTVSGEFVLKDELGTKYIKPARPYSAFFVTIGDEYLPDNFTLIDMSNLIDWFLINSTHPDWKTKYTFWDFDNDGEITVLDIAYVASNIK